MSARTVGAAVVLVLATGFAYVQNETPNNNYSNWARLGLLTRGLRRMGSAAIDLAYVAAGRFDGFWEAALSAWDTAAGTLIVREAGGRVTDYGGEAVRLGASPILATNGRLHDAMMRVLAAALPR